LSRWPRLLRPALGPAPVEWRGKAVPHTIEFNPATQQHTGIKSVTVEPLQARHVEGQESIGLHQVDIHLTSGRTFKARMLPGLARAPVGIVYLKGMIPPPGQKAGVDRTTFREMRKSEEGQKAFAAFAEAQKLKEQNILKELSSRGLPVITFEWTGTYENKEFGSFTEATMKADIDRAIQAMHLLTGAKKAVLSGWSLGATAALWYGAKHANRHEIAGILGMSPYHVQREAGLSGRPIGIQPEETRGHVIQRIVSPQYRDMAAVQFAENFEAGKIFGFLGDPSMRRLARLRVPIVLTHGERDILSFHGRTERIAEEIRRWRQARNLPTDDIYYERVPGTGHDAITGSHGRLQGLLDSLLSDLFGFHHTLHSFPPSARKFVQELPPEKQLSILIHHLEHQPTGKKRIPLRTYHDADRKAWTEFKPVMPGVPPVMVHGVGDKVISQETTRRLTALLKTMNVLQRGQDQVIPQHLEIVREMGIPMDRIPANQTAERTELIGRLRAQFVKLCYETAKQVGVTPREFLVLARIFVGMPVRRLRPPAAP